AAGVQQLRHAADAGRGGEGFVALQVDHDGVFAPAGDVGAFGEAVGAGLVVAPGHRNLHAAALERAGDALVVGRHPYLARAGRQRAPGHVQHQRLATKQAQRLPWQARGVMAGGDGDDEIEWVHAPILLGLSSSYPRACTPGHRSDLIECRSRLPEATPMTYRVAPQTMTTSP